LLEQVDVHMWLMLMLGADPENLANPLLMLMVMLMPMTRLMPRSRGAESGQG